MGTKRPGWTLLNKLHIQNADRRQISRETSPRPGAVAQSERDRERNQEEEQRRERETERVRDKQRNVANNKDPRKTYSDRGRGPAPRDKAGEREWREVERRQEMERGKNVRPVSHLEKGTETEADRGRKKGDTFPRMTRGGKEREGRMAPFVESEEGRGGKKPMDRQMRIEMDDGERERERAWIRERQGDREKHSEREREVFRSRPKKEGERNSSRPMEDGTMQQKGRRREPDPEFRERRRERVVEITDQGVRRERDNPRERDRERERPRPGLAEREGRMPSPRRRREKEAYSDREDGEKMGREARKRDTRSEGDCDGRIQVERLRERRRERGELRHHHSRSEGDAKERMVREREQERWGVEERPRHREKDREREADRLREKGGEKEREMYRERDRRKEKERRPDVERWMDGTRDNKGCREEVRHRPGDRREEEDRYREREEEGGRRRERKEGETDRRWEDAAGCVRQSPSEVLRAQSSGEWSSDVDSERRCRRGGGDSYDERESSRESTAESERETEEEKRCRGDNGRGERSNPDRREEREQRRMWLEPQRGKYSKDSSLEDEVTERERHTTRRKERKRGDERRTESGTGDWEEGGRGECEERDKTYVNRGDAGRGGHSESGRHGRRGETEAERGRETEGVGVDREEASMAQRRRDDGRREHLSDSDRGAEGSHLKDREKEKVTDNAEESGRQEEAGSDHCGCSESEGGSDPGWEQEKDRMWSGEDGFVTVSSSGDDEDEREEEEFVDCREFWEGGMPHDSDQPVSYKGCEEERERHEERKMDEEEGESREGQGRGKHCKYVFCVIGQTLPRSKSGQVSDLGQMEGIQTNDLNSGSSQYDCGQCGNGDTTQPPQNDLYPVLGDDDEYSINDNREAETKGGRDEYNVPREARTYADETSKTDVGYRVPSDYKTTENGDRVKSEEHPYAKIGPTNRDSQTERLLTEWRERNKEDKEQSEKGQEQRSSSPINPYGDAGAHGNSAPDLATSDGTAPVMMAPEEDAAIQIHMNEAWSVTEEAKRHSQPPHLKWAKNVVREILGLCEENNADDPNSGPQADREADERERGFGKEEQNDEKEAKRSTGEMPIYAQVQKQRTVDQSYGADLDEGQAEPLEVEELRGMGQDQAHMHADQLTAMHGDTLTHAHTDTLLATERVEAGRSPTDKQTGPPGSQEAQTTAEAEAEQRKADHVREESGGGVKMAGIDKKSSIEKEVEMYLSVSKTLYKPNSCPSLNYNPEADLPSASAAEVKGQEGGEEEQTGKSEEQEEPDENSTREEVKDRSWVEADEEGSTEGGEVTEEGVGSGGGGGGGLVTSSCSFRDLGLEARIRRRGIRIPTERRKEALVEVEEDEGVGRDRRTRIFSLPDDEDARSNSWGEVDLRHVLDTVGRRKRSSKFFNAAQLYQQYSEAAQNIEILRQTSSDALSTCDEPQVHVPAHLPPVSPSSSPAPSPLPARRPLPPLPPVPHPHSLSHTGSISNSSASAKTLPLPAPPKAEGRPSSPRLSISLTQSATLWRDLPGVRSSQELEELTEDQRRLQEVRFEVVTSEASYCRSLDIVVDHFVKSKQLGALLTTQDRNWLFSRLADVRAISHSFLSKLEERVEVDIMHFAVCDIIARHCQRFKMVYVPYLTNQSYQDATYQRLMNENPGFRRIVEKLERSPVCQRLPLRSFLVLPFQRITRIKLLVQNIVKRTAPGTEEVVQAIKSLKLLEKLIQESNDSISQMKSIESLVSLSAKVDFECRTLPLISQSRRLVREGPVTELMDFSMKETERNIYIHLFNDYLLLSLHKEGGRFTVIDHAPVSQLRAENCRVKLHSLQKNLFRLHLLSKALLLRTDTQSDKLRWISAISRPHPELDFSAAQDFPQMQCMRSFVSQQPDELSLEKADIILVHQQSSDGWVEGTRLSDRHRGWMPESHLETITNSRVRQRNLSDALKLTTATAAV
ncbi:trichohyalin isoform X2 [Lampris incognitus]|uniref:trichohyalin isoform X2 n=1 Tax=Lampris incognitus TaxID=2546036 RepID=UPI0024B5DE7C|nr:trichohyalin isoform X2 [Lampris incognitus]